MKKNLKIPLLVIVGVILLIVIGLFSYLKITGKNLADISDKNAKGTANQQWVDPIFEDENYYYATTGKEILKFRKDSMEQKMIYETETAVTDNFGKELTLHSNSIYFSEIIQKKNTYYLLIRKIDKDGNGDVETLIERKINESEIAATAFTSKNIYYLSENTIYNYDIENNKEDVWLKNVNEDEKYPIHFSVCEDGNLYGFKNSKICRITKEKVEILSDKETPSYANRIVKNGDYLYFVDASKTNKKMEYYNLKDSRKGEISFNSDTKNILYFHGGNTVYMCKGQKIYTVNNEEWQEYCDCSKDLLTHIKNLRDLTSDVVMNQDVLCIKSDKKTEIYNFKDGYFYKDIDESRATKDSYLLYKIESTNFKKFNQTNMVDNGSVYVKNGNNIEIKSGKLEPNQTTVDISSLKNVFCSTDEIQSKLSITDLNSCEIEAVFINNGYCYFVIYSRDIGIEIFRKNTSGSEPLELLESIKDRYITIKYLDDSFLIETFKSIYKYDFAKKELITLYHTDTLRNSTAFKDLKAYIAYLDKEILIIDYATGHMLMSKYDGSLIQVQVFDRSYDLNFADNSALRTYGFKIEDGYLKLFKPDMKGNFTNSSKVVRQLDLNTGKIEEVK